MRQPLLSDANRDNLAALAIHLKSVHRHKFTHRIIFGMMHEDDGAAFTKAQTMPVIEQDNPFEARHRFMDQPSCMVGNPFGHFALIGPDPEMFETWDEYSLRTLGIFFTDSTVRDYSIWITDREWEPDACTMLGMSKSDGLASGTSLRIETMLESGIPDNWHHVGDLMMDT